MTLLRLELTDSLCRSWDLLSITTWANSLQYIPLHIYKECVCVCVYVCVCEPGGIQFMGLQRVGPDWARCMMCTCIHTSYWFCFPGELWLIHLYLHLLHLPKFYFSFKCTSEVTLPVTPPLMITSALSTPLQGKMNCFLSLHFHIRVGCFHFISSSASHDVVFLV